MKPRGATGGLSASARAGKLPVAPIVLGALRKSTRWLWASGPGVREGGFGGRMTMATEPPRQEHETLPDEPLTVPTELVEYARAIQQDAVSLFNRLDAKAAGILGAVGLLAGFGLLEAESAAFVVKKSLERGSSGLPILGVICLVTHAVFLLVTICLALKALFVRKVAAAPSARALGEHYRSDARSECGEQVAQDRLNVRIYKALDDVRAKYVAAAEGKGRFLKASCYCLFLAVLSLALYAACTISLRATT